MGCPCELQPECMQMIIAKSVGELLNVQTWKSGKEKKA